MTRTTCSSAPRMSRPRDTLMAIARSLGDDELRVLIRLAERLRLGMHRYGPLDILHDNRDFAGQEAREEIEDFLVYAACAWLKHQAATSPAAITVHRRGRSKP